MARQIEKYYEADTPRCKFLRTRIAKLLIVDLVDTVLSYNNDIMDNIEKIKEVKLYEEHLPFKLTVSTNDNLVHTIINITHGDRDGVITNHLEYELMKLKYHFSIDIWFANADKVRLINMSDKKAIALNNRNCQEIKDAIIAVNRNFKREGMAETLFFMMGIIENLKKEGFV